MHLFISCDRQPPLLLPNHSAASQYPIRPPQLRPGTRVPLVTVSRREAGGERRREETRERERQKNRRIKTERERERDLQLKACPIRAIKKPETEESAEKAA